MSRQSSEPRWNAKSTHSHKNGCRAPRASDLCQARSCRAPQHRLRCFCNA
jgi:hypothetical protein